ncbi:MAG: glycosyltransferase [Candidatus Sungbacteria bacterium]|uniref:Glycosyltransferase n=1 Tax=Candidatus Sungiibacteriota bacterium TaxID=2750080 RepID=A0A9D6QTJ7_9BACT|nr:glycosyltransferase [Candidatus Sungbacteria bacterium]
MQKGRTHIVFAITKGTWGGAQRYVFTLASHFGGRKNQISVVLGEWGLLANQLQEKNIRVETIGGLERDIRSSEYRVFTKIYQVLKTLRPDVLHANSAKMAGLGALAGRMLGVSRIIVTVHGWTFLEDRPRWQKIIIWFFSWITSLLAHKTIVITKCDFVIGKQMPFVGKKIHYIPIGVNPELYLPFLDREGARKELQTIINQRYGAEITALSDEVWIGANGELTKNKDYETLLEAAANVKGMFKLIIIGDGEEQEILTHIVDQLKLNQRVFFAGFVPDAARLIRAFNIFSMSSIKEGLPYAILEAGLAGVPVVATKVGGIPDIIRSGENGILTNPKDPKSFASAIDKLLEDSSLREKYGAALYETVARDFSLQTMLEKTRAVYGL